MKNTRKQTLKAKMMGTVMLCALVSIVAAGMVSYMTIRIIQDDSIQDHMKLYLDHITENTDRAYFDMLNIANQMGPNGLIGSVVETYLAAQDPFDLYVGQKTLREELVGLGYVNTKLIGANYFDAQKGKELVSCMTARKLDRQYLGVPSVAECAGNRMQAAHEDYLGIGGRTVFSVSKNAVFGNGTDLDIYVEVEAGMEVPEEINQEKRPYTVMQMDQDGIVRYSTNPVIICGQQLLSEPLQRGSYCLKEREGYQIMICRSRIGYLNAAALPAGICQREIRSWRLKMFAVIAISFLVFSVSVVHLYGFIWRPLHLLRRQMIQVGEGQLQETSQVYGIEEFDILMEEINHMKKQVTNLIHSMVEKEKDVQRTEYEKLLYQINPHFLLNTLNSVQWMARMRNQKEISDFVQKLKMLLSYNLGKEGSETTLRLELEILDKYIALQQMRYDFTVEMNVEEGEYLDQPMVRMLLQPLVENAIRYGLGEDEKISIQVFEDRVRGQAVITISDSGKGLNQEEIDQINEPFDYKPDTRGHENRGIGLRYVKAVLDSFYDGQTSLFVNSRKGRGTKITILLPVSLESDRDSQRLDKPETQDIKKAAHTDESTDCR